MNKQKRHRKLKKLREFIRERIKSAKAGIDASNEQKNREQLHYYTGKETAFMELENEISDLIGVNFEHQTTSDEPPPCPPPWPVR